MHRNYCIGVQISFKFVHKDQVEKNQVIILVKQPYRGILASEVTDDFGTTRVMFLPSRDVIDMVVYHNPTIVPTFVLTDFIPRILWQYIRVGVGSLSHRIGSQWKN